jgi:hypothetical protein
MEQWYGYSEGGFRARLRVKQLEAVALRRLFSKGSSQRSSKLPSVSPP